MLNFNQLRVFCHVANLLNYTRAAGKLCITQPAVTAQVKLFEEHCNLKLFKKKGRRVHLTDEGRAIYEHAVKILALEKEIEGVIEDLRELKRGVLHLGTTKTYARYFMPFLLSSFHEAYPQIQIHLSEGSSLEMTHSLLEFRNEVVIIAKAEDHPDVTFVPFSHEEVIPILAPGHRLAKKPEIEFKELAREPVIMKETGSGTRRLINRLFAVNRCSPNVLMETSNTEFIKQLVQRGEGISFLVKEAVALELEEQKLATVRIGRSKPYLDVSIAYLKEQHLSPAAGAFLKILREIVPPAGPGQGIRGIMAGMLADWKHGGRQPTREGMPP